MNVSVISNQHLSADQLLRCRREFFTCLIRFAPGTAHLGTEPQFGPNELRT
jgi:hypothetical protein